MSGDIANVRVLAASKRMGAMSGRGCPIAVKFIVEGEPGERIEWLDDFLDEYCDGVEVGESGLGKSLHSGVSL